MTISVTTDLADMHLCESTTDMGSSGWTTAMSANDDPWIQQSNCLYGRLSATGAWSGALIASRDFSTGSEHFFLWVKNTTWPSTASKANGGVRIWCGSDATVALTGTLPNRGPTNSRQWYVDGGDTVSTAGWICYVVSPRVAASLSLGSPAMNAIVRVGAGAYVTGTVSTKTLNFFLDAFRRGTGLTQTGRAGTTPATFANILATAMSASNAWGVITEEAGILFGAGRMNVGASGQSEITELKDTGRVLVWKNFPVDPDLYGFTITGSASYASLLTLGNYSSGVVSGGCVVKGAGDPAGSTHAVWSVNCGSYGGFKAHGCTLSELKGMALSSTSELRNTAITNSGNVEANGATIFNCTFSNLKTTAPISGDAALVLDSAAESDTVTKCTFTGNLAAIKITAPGTYTFDGHQFSGNTVDVWNTSSGLVHIDAINGCNVTIYTNSGGGSVEIDNPKTLTLTNIKSGSEVRIYAHGTINELAGEESNSTGTFAYNYAYSAGIYVDIVVHHVSGYLYWRLDNYLLAATSMSLPVSQIIERNYSNPA